MKCSTPKAVGREDVATREPLKLRVPRGNLIRQINHLIWMSKINSRYDLDNLIQDGPSHWHRILIVDWSSGIPFRAIIFIFNFRHTKKSPDKGMQGKFFPLPFGTTRHRPVLDLHPPNNRKFYNTSRLEPLDQKL